MRLLPAVVIDRHVAPESFARFDFVRGVEHVLAIMPAF